MVGRRCRPTVRASASVAGSIDRITASASRNAQFSSASSSSRDNPAREFLRCQGLQLRRRQFPSLQVSHQAAGAAGDVQKWNPTELSPFGVAQMLAVGSPAVHFSRSSRAIWKE